MSRSASDHRSSLADGRAVYLDGEVIDVGRHPLFAGIVDTIGDLVEIGGQPDLRRCLPGSQHDAAMWWHTPRTRDDLADRRRASERLAERTCGFVGRGPDHVASFFAGFAGDPSVFGERAGVACDLWREAAQRDLYVSYVIIPPSIDRSRRAEGGPVTQVRVVDQDAEGMVVDGDLILGTGTAVSDWLFVSCIPPLAEGMDDHALSFVVPVATDGLRLHCRNPYGAQTSVFDAPLSTRFDETDGLVVFDNVRVPWEQVLIVGDRAATAAQFHHTSAHTLGNLQAQIRLAVKLRFMLGLAHRIIDVSGARDSAGALADLAELGALTAGVEAHVLAAEYGAQPDAAGVMVPDKRYLYAAMSRQAEIYPRALHLLRSLTSSQLIDLPSSVAAIDHPDLVRHGSSPEISAEERVKLYRLAWDVVGSEFAARHHQYEMFYAGAPTVSAAHLRRTWRFEEATALLDQAMGGWDRSTPLPGS